MNSIRRIWIGWKCAEVSGICLRFWNTTGSNSSSFRKRSETNAVVMGSYPKIISWTLSLKDFSFINYVESLFMICSISGFLPCKNSMVAFLMSFPFMPSTVCCYSRTEQNIWMWAAKSLALSKLVIILYNTSLLNVGNLASSPSIWLPRKAVMPSGSEPISKKHLSIRPKEWDDRAVL